MKEDVTAPGTGLGMSIVKQIVDLSGGRIDIRSVLGKGTEVKLSLPLTDCDIEPAVYPSDPALSYAKEDPVDALRRRAQGRTVTIRGFDSSPGDSDLRVISLSSLKDSIVKYVTEWFHLAIVSNDQIADIVISDESAFLSSAVDPDNKFRSQLILCSNGARRNIYMSRLEPGQTVEFVSKPCGPHRIAKALLNCLDTEDALKKAGIRLRVSDSLNACNKPQPSTEANITMVTAGTSSNARLIGDLQSSIGFSPTASNLSRSEMYSTSDSRQRSSRRPTMQKRMSSGVVPKTDTLESLSSTSTSTSNETSEASSNYETQNSSMSFLDQEPPNLELPHAAGTSSPRRPKMLLVEVRLHMPPHICMRLTLPFRITPSI